MPSSITRAFLAHAANILTDNGLTGPKLVEILNNYAYDYQKDIPHAKYPFDAINKRTALLDNLLCFDPKQQYVIIAELCDRLNSDGNNQKLTSLKAKLRFDYGSTLDTLTSEHVSESLITETRHWLSSYPEVKKLIDSALEKHSKGIYQRNSLDDLRLALEILLKNILSNSKSLEHQTKPLGEYIKQRGTSAEFRNMFERLLDYYTKYQNTYIKHDDKVVASEIDFIFEITCTFMKPLLRMDSH